MRNASRDASAPRSTHDPSPNHANAANGKGRVSKCPQMSDDLLRAAPLGARELTTWLRSSRTRTCSAGEASAFTCQDVRLGRLPGICSAVFSSFVSYYFPVLLLLHFSSPQRHTPCLNHSRPATSRCTTRLTISGSSSTKTCTI